VGEVASSNLVVPTIYLFIFSELSTRLWVCLAKAALILPLIGPIFSQLIDLL
jgi:hypothetical protein